MIESIAKRSALSAGMVAASVKGRDLMGGTAAMRAAGKTYLMINPAESEESYQARLSQSWLFNAYANTERANVERSRPCRSAFSSQSSNFCGAASPGSTGTAKTLPVIDPTVLA